jgi:hypothetical protein
VPPIETSAQESIYLYIMYILKLCTHCIMYIMLRENRRDAECIYKMFRIVAMFQCVHNIEERIGPTGIF